MRNIGAVVVSLYIFSHDGETVVKLDTVFVISQDRHFVLVALLHQMQRVSHFVWNIVAGEVSLEGGQ